MIKKIFTALFTLAFLLIAFPGYAYTLEDIREDVGEIRGDVETLSKEIAEAIENREIDKPDFPGIPESFRFERHLRFRDYGEDVKYLQIILNSTPETRLIEEGVGSPGNEVERFGNMTRNAVMNFQEMFAEEILHPWGISEPTGIVEIQTKKKLNKILDGQVTLGKLSSTKRQEFNEEILRIVERIREVKRRLEDYQEGAEDAPTNLEATIIAYGEVELTWRGDEDAEEFIGYKAKESGGPYTEVGYTTEEKGVVRDLEADETYYFVVTQVVDGEESGYSREVRVTMDWAPTPFDIQAEATDIGELTLTWETDQDVEEFDIYRATRSGGPYKQIANTTRNKFIDTGLGLYTVYYYVVTQVVDGEESEYSKEYIDSWFYNWQGGNQPHPDKDEIDFD